ncbi:hypothetical protein YH66_05205 [[Brevibacterium] flavum]|uniref:Uncharacterized protein n=1 Tax=[Brevibacterium] flavum TaxID=92706 RepID=A0A0F6Z502_9CORY|nr:hypothetical protein [Corynebacterium glutamicum]AKF26996.1 hypothetical protein YH66_05205 [[Brevibacterium] flavum]ANE07818.1 hypothetical protein A3654_05195 [Corynebacterium glutamicum]AST20234.1 hypothetical protein CEY17_05260 [Corynebacterium glutamicum ATCC 14067]KEI22708.1 hypothetical protein KIQ_009045 [Corynebacterium glutamicum ATCC 14067]KIH74253.1 hypothetical protein SD36_05230 [Corynebacterium glutamicum]
MNEGRIKFADLGYAIGQALDDLLEALQPLVEEWNRAVRQLQEALSEFAELIEENRNSSKTAEYVELMQLGKTHKTIRVNTKPHHLKALYRRRTP